MSPSPGARASVPARLAERALLRPEAPGLHTVTFVERQPVAKAYSNRELFSRAEGASAVLEERGVRRNDRVVLALADAADFTAYLLGAQCVGAIPVPAPSLSDLSHSVYGRRLRSIMADADPTLTVVDDAAAASIVRHVCSSASVLACDAPQLTRRPRASEFSAHRDLDDVAFLQYTSGSTGDPRGVVVLHRNLVANIEGIFRGAAMTDDDIVYSWLPLFHDMGLVAALSLALYSGLRTYLASPRTFLLRPESWLRAITALRATFSAGPNFAFDVLAHKVPDRALVGLDLRSWRLAFDGAEPVHSRTMEAFVARFAAHGFDAMSFRPAYGLAECTLAVSFPRPGTPNQVSTVQGAALRGEEVARPAAVADQDAVGHTSVGVALPDHEIRIAPRMENESLPERHVGEIVVRGPSVTPGYYRDLAAGAPARSELRTGDLGYIADGALYVVGRLKDILCIAGKKYAPSDIEHRIGRVEGVRQNDVVAFALQRDGTERVCLALALEPGASSHGRAIVEEVERVMMADFGIAPADVVIVRPGALARTSSGKVMRSSCAMLYRTNRLGSTFVAGEPRSLDKGDDCEGGTT